MKIHELLCKIIEQDQNTSKFFLIHKIKKAYNSIGQKYDDGDLVTEEFLYLLEEILNRGIYVIAENGEQIIGTNSNNSKQDPIYIYEQKEQANVTERIPTKPRPICPPARETHNQKNYQNIASTSKTETFAFDQIDNIIFDSNFFAQADPLYSPSALKNNSLKATKRACPSVTTVVTDEEEEAEKSEEEDTNILPLHRSQCEQKKVLEHALTHFGPSLRKEQDRVHSALKNNSQTTKRACPSVATNEEESEKSEEEDTNILPLHQSQCEQKKVLEHALTHLEPSLKKEKDRMQENANNIIRELDRELDSDINKVKEVLEKQKKLINGMLKKGGEFLTKQEKSLESSDKFLENINEFKRKYENLSKLCENTCYKHFIERLSEEKIESKRGKRLKKSSE